MENRKSRGGSRRRNRFAFCRFLMLAMLSLAIGGVSSNFHTCPKECKCRTIFDPERGGVLRVMCLEGDMHVIPVESIDRSVFKLVIAAPTNLPNYLTIGPILSQPHPFSELRELQVVNSNIPSIGQFSFWGLKNLKVLNLTHNNITSIRVENFRGLANLTDLFLSYNKIENMPSEAFRYCISLKTLVLSNNEINHLMPRIFRMLAKLQTLDLSNNPLSELDPEVFKDIQKLKILKCRNCMLKRINTQIYYITPELEVIDLGENLFKYLTVDEFTNLKKLRHLKLDGNQLSVIVDNMFGQNKDLEYLDLAYNRLALLAPGALTNLTKLSHLDIAHNKIDRFHLQTFAPVVESLRTIDFSGNNMPLNEVAIVMQILPDLNSIGLANLSLPEIPPNFFIYNEQVSALDISWNKLTKFPLTLLKKTKYLRQLDISHNKIKKLEEADLQRLEAIPEINLEKNTWDCDQCSAGIMLVYMSTTVLNGSLRNLRCYAPMRLRGIKLSDMTFDTLEVCNSSTDAQMTVIAALVLVLVAALAAVSGALCCSRRRTVRYYTNEEKRREGDPEELLPEGDNGSVATIHTPTQSPGSHS